MHSSEPVSIRNGCLVDLSVMKRVPVAVMLTSADDQQLVVEA
jgi:hypothetical protein